MFKICRENKFSPINTGGVRLFYIIHQPKNHKKFALPFFSLYFCNRKACKTLPKLHKRKTENNPISSLRHSEGIPISYRRITALSKHVFTRTTMNTNLPSSTHFKSYPQKIITNMPVYTKSLFPSHSRYKDLQKYILLRQVRLRLGSAKEKNSFFLLHYTRLALTLHHVSKIYH